MSEPRYEIEWLTGTKELDLSVECVRASIAAPRNARERAEVAYQVAFARAFGATLHIDPPEPRRTLTERIRGLFPAPAERHADERG